MFKFVKTTFAFVLCMLLLSNVKPLNVFNNNDAYETGDFLLGGIQINEAELETWTKNLTKNGFNTVEVTVYARQNIWNTDDIIYAEEDEGVINEIKHAKTKGLKVAMILRVTLDHKWEENKFLWHGMIMPKNDSLLNSWFKKYNQFVLKWAKVAENMGVDYLAIGSELNSMAETIETRSLPPSCRLFLNDVLHKSYESRILKFKKQLQDNDLWVQGFDSYKNPEKYIADKLKAQKEWAKEVSFVGFKNDMERFNNRRKKLDSNWRSIILNTKKVYNGKLSFAANFDSYNTVSFWDDLDYLSVNAYFKLRSGNLKAKNNRQLEKQISNHWRKHLNDIQNFKTRRGLDVDKGVVFSELGYTNKQDVTICPWKGFGFSISGTGPNQRLIIWDKQPENLNERAAAIRCLAKEVLESNFPLKGVLYWKFTSHRYHLPHEPFAICIGDTEQVDPAIEALKHLLVIGKNNEAK